MSSLSLANVVNWKGLKENCACESCHVSSLRYSLSGRKIGIRLCNDWFCSDECFRAGVEARISSLRDAPLCGQPQHRGRIPLSLLLLSRGCITHTQLQIALAQQRARGGSLGDILCELNFATERQVAQAAATQWGCPLFAAPANFSDLAVRIPSTLMKLIVMVPVHYVPGLNKLLVGFVHAIEHKVLRTIEEMTSCVAEPCFIMASQCRENIRMLSDRNLEVRFEHASSTNDMAGIIQSYAFQIGADEARLGLCRDYVWARLNRGNSPTDLLFSLSGNSVDSISFDKI